ncbi:MAG: hypothetical protein ACFB8W_10940 [Elainellaceae cyanobacterium]
MVAEGGASVWAGDVHDPGSGGGLQSDRPTACQSGCAPTGSSGEAGNDGKGGV